MIRFFLWAVFTVCTLNTVSFEVHYKDGLHLKSVGWPERLSTWRQKYKKKKP